MKDYRKLKVYEQAGPGYKPTAAIIMKGKWLEEFGFEPETPISVKCEEGRLIITKMCAQAG